jgi:dTDP-4-amino-4,6-dideoxygalactose transaminase
MSRFIPYGRHNVNESDVEEVVNALKSDWLTTGPYVQQFEAALEGLTGAPTVAVSSGTAALHSAYSALELKSTDEVITPPLTFIATQAAIHYSGGVVKFADTKLGIPTLDPKSAEAAINKNTRAIVAVDFAGIPSDLDELKLLTEKYGLTLIDDAAHSFGSKYKNRKIGQIADMTTFSFFPTKNLTTGEGGAVSSIDSDLLDRVRLFSRQGIVRETHKFSEAKPAPWHQEVHAFGLNYRLSDINCALGLSQIMRFEEFKKKRLEVATRYFEEFSKFEEIKLPVLDVFVEPVWHFFPIIVSANLRRELFEFLHSRGVRVQVNYIPAHLHPVFRKQGYKRGMFPNSESYYDGEISLPVFAGITHDEVSYVIDSVKEFFR